MEALITILAGAHGLVEANKRVRPDRGLQRAFGRSGCAEQSVIQDTLDACTSENVKQMEEALAVIYRQYSQGYRHPYDQQYQILDIDLTGRPGGPKAAFATPGYFSRQRNRRGRQVGYVVASLYEEVVVQQVFAGNESLPKVLRPLVEAADSVLELDEAKRLVGKSPEKAGDPQAVLWAYVRFYDQRGGGVEIEIKEGKHGLGSLRRKKKRFEAQQMVVLLEALAHNLLVWVRGWLADACPRLARWGLLRWIRDVIHITYTFGPPGMTSECSFSPFPQRSNLGGRMRRERDE